MTTAEWLACADPDVMLTYLGRRVSNRKLRLFGCACYRHVPRFIEDERVWMAVEVSERYADGLVNRRELTRALSVAFVKMWTNAGSMAFPTPRCIRAARHATARAARDGAAERQYQAAVLRDIFGSPRFRPIPVQRSWLAWNDSIVQSLAEAVYEERSLPEGMLDQGRLAVLADALEEAGCDNQALLAHCRSAVEHVRGCWAIDVILCKS